MSAEALQAGPPCPADWHASPLACARLLPPLIPAPAPSPPRPAPPPPPSQLRDDQLGVLLELKRADKAAAKAPFEPRIRSWESTYYARMVGRRGGGIPSHRAAPH
jgi:hypothetical protein